MTSSFQQNLQRAFALFQQGRLPEAEKVARRAAREVPPNAQLLQFIALVCSGQEKHDDAVALCEQAVQLVPSSAEGHYNLGTALMRQGNAVRAISSLQRSIEISPRSYDALNNLALSLLSARRATEAEAAARRAIALTPQKPAAHHTLAVTLRFQHRHDEAIASLEHASARGHPDPGEVLLDLGQTFLAAGRIDDALAQFRAAVRHKPKSAKFLFSLAEAESDAGRFADAAKHYEAALASKPNDVPALIGLANARLHLADWSDYQSLRDRIRHGDEAALADANPFTLLTLFDDPEFHSKSARLYAGKYSTPVTVPALRPHTRPHKLRVAYLSSDFRTHATSILSAGLYEHHDRSRFETIAISWSRDDRSDLRRRVAAGVDRFIDVERNSPDQTVEIMRKLSIDIAVDLNGYTRARRDILVQRPAPVQVSFLGYPGTMGASWIDYIIADSFVVPPGAERQFSEKLIYLPNCYQVNDDKRAKPSTPPARATLGLPTSGLVFASFNRTHKTTPDLFAVWLRLLQQVPGSVLWLLCQDEVAQANLRREAAGCGVEGHRLIFAASLPYQEHLTRLQCADLFLDTLPYNGHTTASDALWVGVPVLTCPGKAFPARVAGSLLRAIELPQLIASSLHDYEAKALELAHNHEARVALRAELQSKRKTTPLFDTARFTRYLEVGYDCMWQQWLSGQAPTPVYLSQ